MTALTVLTLTADDRRLLAMFHPDSITIHWDPTAMDWTVGIPLFGLSDRLVSRLDRLLLDGLIEPMPQDGPLWKVNLTGRGRTALSLPPQDPA